MWRDARSPPMPLIEPHGGKLINRIVEAAVAAELAREAQALPKLRLSPREQCDLEMIAIGAFSPLRGFMGSADFASVCSSMRLSNGTVFPIPIVVSPPDEITSRISQSQRIALTDDQDRVLAVMTVREKYPHDKQLEITSVYRTEDDAHPGVATVRREGSWCLAGDLEVITPNPDPEFPEHRLAPAQTRAEFDKRGWQTIAAFQTRNPIHRAHEYLTKCALEVTDGLLIHPLVGETKSDDIPADVRMCCYQVLIDGYYNSSRTMLSVMPLAMRYAGPREAVLHAIIRKNYGCTHFIVGRDHAGVGTYYGTYDAQKIFAEFDITQDLGIVPLKFEHAAWCRTCESMVSAKTCPHGPATKVHLSGTKVREMLKSGQRPPMEFSRPEVADILIQWARQSA
jgi:sulfate adenylyltransferase